MVNLLVGCLASLAVIYSTDVIIGIFWQNTMKSELTVPIVDFLRYLSSGLIGFLFASKTNK